MKIEQKFIYSCDHCRKKYFMKHACVDHEIKCSKNPVNFRACVGCVHLGKKEVSLHEYNIHGGTSTRKIEILYCSKVNEFLHPPSSEYKGNAFLQKDLGNGETPNNPMKKVCSFFDGSVQGIDLF